MSNNESTKTINQSDNILEVSHLKKYFPIKGGFFGGATGGIIGMNVFRHKTLKKKFSVGIPSLFVLQLILNSFILGFLGFWTFF